MRRLAAVANEVSAPAAAAAAELELNEQNNSLSSAERPHRTSIVHWSFSQKPVAHLTLLKYLANQKPAQPVVAVFN